MDDLDWFIESAVKAAPPLTPEQRLDLGDIFGPAHEAVMRDKQERRAQAAGVHAPVTVETEMAA